MNSTASLHAQGARDARTLIARADEYAHARFMFHSGEVSVGATDQTLAYFEGFRSVIDVHLAAVERESIKSSSPEGHLTVIGEFDVFREGSDYVFYSNDEEVLAYRAPKSLVE